MTETRRELLSRDASFDRLEHVPDLTLTFESLEQVFDRSQSAERRIFSGMDEASKVLTRPCEHQDKVTYCTAFLSVIVEMCKRFRDERPSDP